MRKSSPRTQNYRAIPSQNAVLRARFREQMSDYTRGERLRQLREGRHESQESIAAELGVSTKTLRAWEHGGKIRWINAKKLAEFYGVSADELVSREAPDVFGEHEPAPTQLDRIEAKLAQLEETLGQKIDALLEIAVEWELQVAATEAEARPPVARKRANNASAGRAPARQGQGR